MSYQTGPQSRGRVLQLCPLFREARQDHSPQGVFYSSARSSEKPDRTTVPRARSTVLLPLQRSQKAAVAPWSNAARTAAGQHGAPCEDHSFPPNPLTDHLRQDYARKQKKKENSPFCRPSNTMPVRQWPCQPAGACTCSFQSVLQHWLSATLMVHCPRTSHTVSPRTPPTDHFDHLLTNCSVSHVLT